MKNIKLLICTFCIIVVSCCSCGLFASERYSCNIEEVESIQIVSLGGFNKEENKYEYTVISQISDCETFVNRLNDIKYSVNLGEPTVLNPEYTVILINYNNGDYDLLYSGAQCYYREGRFLTGYVFFNTEQFNALISDYTTE